MLLVVGALGHDGQIWVKYQKPLHCIASKQNIPKSRTLSKVFYFTISVSLDCNTAQFLFVGSHCNKNNNWSIRTVVVSKLYLICYLATRVEWCSSKLTALQFSVFYFKGVHPWWCSLIEVISKNNKTGAIYLWQL